MGRSEDRHLLVSGLIQNPERIRYRQGYLMRRGHLTEGFERFNAL